MRLLDSTLLADLMTGDNVYLMVDEKRIRVRVDTFKRDALINYRLRFTTFLEFVRRAVEKSLCERSNERRTLRATTGES